MDAAAGKGVSLEAVKEELGIEDDEDEHREVEMGELCAVKGMKR